MQYKKSVYKYHQLIRSQFTDFLFNLNFFLSLINLLYLLPIFLIDILINTESIAIVIFQQSYYLIERKEKKQTVFKYEYIKLPMNSTLDTFHFCLQKKRIHILSKKKKTNTIFDLVATVGN